jgi:hypothetical protein
MKQSQSTQKDNEDYGKDNPALSKVIERNIRTIIHLRTKAAHVRNLQSRIVFAYVHIVWFGVWILPNTTRFGVRVLIHSPTDF